MPWIWHWPASAVAARDWMAAGTCRNSSSSSSSSRVGVQAKMSGVVAEGAAAAAEALQSQGATEPHAGYWMSFLCASAADAAAALLTGLGPALCADALYTALKSVQVCARYTTCFAAAFCLHTCRMCR
jgi:hypothetical protein